MSQKYRVILTDPPWSYNDRRKFRKDNPHKKAVFGIGAEGNYSIGTMPTEDICALGEKIKLISADDAYLFLWATCPRLPDALEVMEAWGFEYVTVAFNWVKTNKNSGTPFSAPGAYSWSNMEPVLLGKKRIKKLWHSNASGCEKPHQIILEPHPRNEQGKIIHSRKPESMHIALEKWLGPFLGDYGMMELFATQQRPGWTCLGHAISGKTLDIELDEIVNGTI
jgi:N6-adenosine-specific RNA methylase IME4